MVLNVIKVPPKGQKHIVGKNNLYWGMTSQTRRKIGKLLMGFASTLSSKVLIPSNPEYTTLILLSEIPETTLEKS